MTLSSGRLSALLTGVSGFSPLPLGTENCQVKPGDTVAIVGAGPVGLAVLLTAQFHSPVRVTLMRGVAAMDAASQETQKNSSECPTAAGR
jgi:threonine dehydrogenase-like Zn-dependent dehydrogenase